MRGTATVLTWLHTAPGMATPGKGLHDRGSAMFQRRPASRRGMHPDARDLSVGSTGP